MALLGNIEKYALPVLVSLSLIEALILSAVSAERYDWKATAVSLFDILVRRYSRLVALSISAPLFLVLWHYRVATLPLNTAWGIVLLFLGQDFCYYWYHRAAHRVRWFWASHVVHHSPNELNLSAAYRLGWTSKLTGSGLFYAPLVWLGVPPLVVTSAVTLNLLYQFWIHATWIPKLGWLEYILNTPSAHRVHHAANTAYLDANYGGVLIVWDRLFGTYIAEREDTPPRYGLVHPMRSYNPLVVEFQAWWGLACDLRSARSLREAANYLIQPPGWAADGESNTTEDIRRRAASEQLALAAK